MTFSGVNKELWLHLLKDLRLRLRLRLRLDHFRHLVLHDLFFNKVWQKL